MGVILDVPPVSHLHNGRLVVVIHTIQWLTSVCEMNGMRHGSVVQVETGYLWCIAKPSLHGLLFFLNALPSSNFMVHT
jgi:hypothetical protein